MKKILSITLLSLMMTTLAMAQTKNVKKAFKLSEAYENPDFYQAEELIEQALADPTTANDPYTWWVAGHIQDRKIFIENEKLFAGESGDRELQFEAAFKAFDYFMKAVELEKLPNAKGKIVDKYTKKIAETLAWYYKGYYIFNYGLKQAEYEDYNLAVNAFEKHLSIPDLPFMAGYKGNDDAPKPVKDTTFYKIQYYNAIYTQYAGDTVGAIAKFEATKNNGVEENTIYQNLYNLYKDTKDSVNMLRILNEGIDRFPNESVYLGLMINHYLEKGKQQEAIDMLKKAIARNPQNAQYYNVLGYVYGNVGNTQDAIANFDKAIAIDPTNALYHYKKGEFLFFRATDLDAVASNTPNKSEAQRLKTEVNRYIADAKVCFTKAAELDAKDPQNFIMLRNIATRENNMKEYDRLSAIIDNL